MNKNFPELIKYTNPKTQKAQVPRKMHLNKFTLGFHYIIMVLLVIVLYPLPETPFRSEGPILPAHECAAV